MAHSATFQLHRTHPQQSEKRKSVYRPPLSTYMPNSWRCFSVSVPSQGAADCSFVLILPGHVKKRDHPISPRSFLGCALPAKEWYALGVCCLPPYSPLWRDESMRLKVSVRFLSGRHFVRSIQNKWSRRCVSKKATNI